MNWDDLRIFLAVARHGTLAAAAKANAIDATTVGRRLVRLERDLGTTLFEIQPAGHVLTERGGRLMRHAEAIEASAIDARGEVAGERGLLSGTIRVSVAEGFGTWIVARYLAAFHRAHPGIVVELIASTGFLNPSKREADIAVMLARPTTGPLVSRRLTDYRLGLYASPAYLAGNPPVAGIGDLRDHVLIGYVPDTLYSPALDYAAEVRPGRAPDIRSSSINAQGALTVAGAGICVLPAFIGDQDDRLVPVLADEIAIVRTFWLVVHKDVRRLARIAAFVDWLVDVAARERALFAGR